MRTDKDHTQTQKSKVDKKKNWYLSSSLLCSLAYANFSFTFNHN